jgi:hypothetical protein
MRICGVELKGSEAVLCVLGYNLGAFELPDCRQRQFAVSSSEETEAIRKFQFAIKKLFEDYKVDRVAIIKREQKGKFAGSATSFKLEAALQLLDMPVEVITPSTMKDQLKRNPLQADFASLGLKKFQQQAFNCAYAAHNLILYRGEDASE